jgi:hypothetical protein
MKKGKTGSEHKEITVTEIFMAVMAVVISLFLLVLRIFIA